MTTSGVLLTIAVLCAAWATASAILITRALDQRGLTTPLPFIGMFLFRNLARQRYHAPGNGKGRNAVLFVRHSDQRRAHLGPDCPCSQELRVMSVLAEREDHSCATAVPGFRPENEVFRSAPRESPHGAGGA